MNMTISFDTTTIALSFIVAFSILFGIEILKRFISHFDGNVRSKKQCNPCIASLIIWFILFQLAPYGLFIAHNHNLALLILGYPLSFLFTAILFVIRLYQKLTSGLSQNLSQMQPNNIPSLNLVSTESSLANAVRISVGVESKKNTIDILMGESLLTLTQGGMFWMLCLSKKPDSKPIGYMACNLDGYCYNNCQEPQESMFEIIPVGFNGMDRNGTDRNYVQIVGTWKDPTTGQRSKRYLSAKEQGHWNGYVGMLSNDHMVWKLIQVETLAENGFLIQYIVDGNVRGWLGHNQDNQWCKIMKNEEDASVYILGKH